MARLIGLFAILVLMVSLPGLVHAQKRVALVIGNGAYTSVSPLANPPNDARLMANTLRNIGFEVIEKIDANQKDMKRAVRDFGKFLQSGGDDTVGLFYYAGHGVQVKGSNFIIPVDAQIAHEGDVDIEAINANAILSMMEHTGSDLNFVILDACRNNPFMSNNRSGNRGLAEMDAPTGSFIAYATSPGDVAADGNGSNSPYTLALSNAMLEPDVAVELMFKKVRNTVRKTTNNTQTPWESSSLIGGNFFFNPAEPQAEPTTITTSISATQNNIESLEKQFWGEIKESTNPAMFEAYLSQFPSGMFVPIAKVKIASLTPKTTPVLQFSITPLDEEMITVKSANVRSQPLSQSDKIGNVITGKLVSVTGKTSMNGASWYRVALVDGRTGYVFGTLLQKLVATPITTGTNNATTTRQSSQTPDETVWHSIKNSTDLSDYELFIQQYPDSPFVVYSQKKMDKLKQDNLVVTSLTKTTPLTTQTKNVSTGLNGFKVGKFKPKVLSSNSWCKHIRLNKMTATTDSIKGTYIDDDERGRIKITDDNGKFSARFTGSSIRSTQEEVKISGSSLLFKFLLRFPGEGSCRISFQLQDVLNK